ncbi:kelch-like protein 23 isoform X2 [Physella acuta]|uniref:kelch-like protein 23 isoform X2 n=1 Tax=Physella acuta TaxID=109671 RepID=UPI0027DB40FD|nr:kelch-like protein 23 isoform X2 [Physella acuta]
MVPQPTASWRRNPYLQPVMSPSVFAESFDVKTAKEIFNCFQNNMENCTDFTVDVGGNKFNCHKFVLSSCSGFFEALMRTDMREKFESSCKLHDISPEIFGLILDVIYNAKTVLTEENMLEMWHASVQLQIKFLISACESFVKENLTLHNYWKIYKEAKLLDANEVIKKVKQLMVANCEKIVKSDVLMQLSLEELMPILMNNSFPGADSLVGSVLKWTCADDSYLDDVTPFDEIDPTLRRSYLGLLLALIPLKNTTEACLTKLKNNKHVIENTGAITLVSLVAIPCDSATKTKTTKVNSNFTQPSASQHPIKYDASERIANSRPSHSAHEVHDRTDQSSDSESDMDSDTS